MKLRTKLLLILCIMGMLVTMFPTTTIKADSPCVHSNVKEYCEWPATCETYGRHKFFQCESCGANFFDKAATQLIYDSSWVAIPPTGHNIVVSDSLAPTCVDPGYTAKVYCSSCGKVFVEATEIPKVAHKCKTIVEKATAKKDGSITEWCTVCGTTVSKTKILKASNISLSSTTYKYSGDKITPVVTVKDSKGKVISSDNYTVTYSNNKKVGTAKVTIKFKNNYSGTVVKKFKIVK